MNPKVVKTAVAAARVAAPTKASDPAFARHHRHYYGQARCSGGNGAVGTVGGGVGGALIGRAVGGTVGTVKAVAPCAAN